MVPDNAIAVRALVAGKLDNFEAFVNDTKFIPLRLLRAAERQYGKPIAQMGGLLVTPVFSQNSKVNDDLRGYWDIYATYTTCPPHRRKISAWISIMKYLAAAAGNYI